MPAAVSDGPWAASSVDKRGLLEVLNELGIELFLASEKLQQEKVQGKEPSQFLQA